MDYSFWYLIRIKRICQMSCLCCHELSQYEPCRQIICFFQCSLYRLQNSSIQWKANVFWWWVLVCFSHSHSFVQFLTKRTTMSMSESSRKNEHDLLIDAEWMQSSCKSIGQFCRPESFRGFFSVCPCPCWGSVQCWVAGRELSRMS